VMLPLAGAIKKNASKQRLLVHPELFFIPHVMMQQNIRWVYITHRNVSTMDYLHNE
jgi:hypothetical protein